MNPYGAYDPFQIEGASHLGASVPTSIYPKFDIPKGNRFRELGLITQPFSGNS